jgi:hypothetical protein
MVTGCCLSRVAQLPYDLLPLTSAEDKGTWSYASTLPYAFMPPYLMKNEAREDI